MGLHCYSINCPHIIEDNFNFVNECIEVINDTFIGNPTEYTLEDITNQLINTYKFTEEEVNAAVEETNLASYFN